MRTEPTAKDDESLLWAARGGDLQAFGQLVLRHQGMVRACLAARMGGPDQADDLAQETFLVAHRRLEEFKPADPLGPWLRTIALNLLRNYQRKFRPESIGSHHELEQLVAAGVERAGEAESEAERVEALRECLAGMDEGGRKLIQSRYAEGLSIRELTDRHGMAHSALTMRLFRLRSALAACVTGKLTISGARN